MKRAVYGAMSTDQLAGCLVVFSEPGALSAAFNWYRSPEFLTGELGGNVEQPILYVFGNRDMPVFVRTAVRKLHPRFATEPFEEVEVDAGYWLIEEKPGRVVDAVLRPLRAQASKPQVSARTGAGMLVRVARADNAESFDTLSSRVNLVAA